MLLISRSKPTVEPKSMCTDQKSLNPEPYNNLPAEHFPPGLEGEEPRERAPELFVPGGIHTRQSINFWKKELKAGEWVMDLLENGYAMPLEGVPPKYEERNNCSARQHKVFVRETVLKMAQEGIVQLVKEKPHCVSPLSVVAKIGPMGAQKLRLCWDGSRCVNKYLKEQKVSLAHFQRVLELTHEKDLQTKYDLKSAYHHIRMVKHQTKYLGAAFEKEDGQMQYFEFLFLAFGVASAVHCITKLFKPINAYFHGKGISHSIYIDDGRALAKTEEEAEENRVFIYQTLKKAGWTIEKRKSDGRNEAARSKEYLGFVIDTEDMKVRLNHDKKEQIKKAVEEVIQFGIKSIHVKVLAKAVGQMVATEPALGNMPLMAARAAYIQIEETTEKTGWNANLQLSHETLAGLEFFTENLDNFDNTPIRTAATEVSVISIIGKPDEFIKTSFVSNHVKFEGEKTIWASDSSGFATCAYSVTGEKMYYRGKLTAEQRGLSSGHRELLAVRQTLEFYTRSWVTSKQPINIYWLTDSKNLVRFLSKGSGKKQIQAEIFQVMLLCQKLNIRIIPIHLLRDDPRIKIADNGSKQQDTDDWQVDHATFQLLNKETQFTIDLFADNHNTRCKRFYSNFYCSGTSGIDAFCHSWNNEVAWICPPIKEINRTIKKIRESKLSGILFVPEWQTADYWFEIFDKKSCLKWPFISCSKQVPFLVQKELNYRSPFSGRAKFNFLAIYFKT